MGDRKHHEASREQSTAADDLGLGLPAELPPPELQEAPGLKRHGDKLEHAIESRAGRRDGSAGERSDGNDPTAQADGDDGNPESGARGRQELRETRRGS
ncbi:MAG TPA: hypothetical protein VFT04_02185 [Gemmatimonadales bacterium]|nr:hypothetical protein [Gemmatimonadales bacterium]